MCSVPGRKNNVRLPAELTLLSSVTDDWVMSLPVRIVTSRHPRVGCVLFSTRPSLTQRATTNRGNTVAYVGEGRDCFDADDRFFDLLEADWQAIHTVDIPTWTTPMMADRLEIYRRR